MKTAEDCVQLLAENGFDKTLPHFAKAARILASIPATSSAERSFFGTTKAKDLSSVYNRSSTTVKHSSVAFRKRSCEQDRYRMHH